MATAVKAGSVTVRYTIYKTEVDGEEMFDWVTSTGDESDEYFASAEGAERDILRKLGG